MPRNTKVVLILITAVVLIGASFVLPSEAKAQALDDEIADCLGVYYAPLFEGNITANGELFLGEGGFTTAHKTLPFGSIIYVENLNSGAWALLRVNDRGPAAPGYCVDTSEPWLVDYGAAPMRVVVVYLAEDILGY